MREILFRGKRIDNGEWVEGSLIYDGSGRCCIAVYPSLAFGPTSKDEINGETLWGFYPFFEIGPRTIGQYTGLTDKNGKKVFEGDILKITDEFENSVVWSVDCKNTAFSVNQKGVNYSTYLGEFDTGRYDIEIIGNVHDNPELMEDDNDTA